MTVHVSSVGRSVLDALDGKSGKLTLSRAARDRAVRLLEAAGISTWDREQASHWIAAAVAHGEPSAQARALRDAIAAVTPQYWQRDVSAELATLDGVNRDRMAIPVREEDIAVLVCSDTPDGLLAGVWNALGMTAGNLAAVRYLAQPGAELGDVRGRAVVVRVPGMDVGSAEGFRQAMRGLGVLARHVFESLRGAREPEKFRFYLSGGFKAAIPYLIGLAEAVRSIDKQRLAELGVPDLMPRDGSPYPVEAYVLHETAGGDLTDAPPIKLPLRRLVASAVRQELTGFGTSGKRRGLVLPDLLNGYAYEARGRRDQPDTVECELTAFGAGLRELFGVRDESPAG